MAPSRPGLTAIGVVSHAVKDLEQGGGGVRIEDRRGGLRQLVVAQPFPKLAQGLYINPRLRDTEVEPDRQCLDMPGHSLLVSVPVGEQGAHLAVAGGGAGLVAEPL